MTYNELLMQAFAETADEHFSQYDLTSEEKPHRFSLVYKIKKKSVLRLAKKYEKLENTVYIKKRRHMPLKRMAVLITAISVLAALGIAAGAGYAVIRKFNIYTQSSHSFGITYNETVLDVDYSKYDIKSEIAMDEFYCLPEESGCTFVERGMYDQQMNCIEYDRNGKLVSFGQYVSGTGLFMDDISDVVFHDVVIKGGDGVLCTETDSEDKSLTWVQDGYIFDIYAKEISVEEIMRLAEMITTYEADPSEFYQPSDTFDFHFLDYGIKDTIEEQYWLPPETGYELVDERTEEHSVQLDYYHNGAQVSFSQSVNSNMGVDVGFDIYKVSVKDSDIAYICRYDDGEDNLTSISWVYDGYEFDINFFDYNITDEELIGLAESIVVRD